MHKLSAIVITYNEEENIRECIESLKWTEEIIIVDSKSADKTIEIAKEFTANIITTENLSYGEKRNMGINAASGDWILWIDADERVSDELKNEITQTISGSSADEAYYINRRSFFINKFIKHSGWYPDYTLRLFKKSTNIKFDTAKVHEKAYYEGKTGRLKNQIIHYTDRTFEHYLKKLNSYTTLSAEELHNQNKKASLFDIIFRPVFTFFKMYFLKLGILDGYMGLVLCSFSSIHVMVKYSKLYYLIKGR
jgi:glycosyltransferase involved in cell wall biosynthesis